MVVAKRSQGGLGYAKIEFNHRVDVPNEFKYLAKAGYFEIDVYANVVMVCLPTAPRRRTKAPLKAAVPVSNHEFSQVVLTFLERFASVALETHSERDGVQ